MGEERFQPVATSSDAMSGMDSVGTPSKPSRSARAGARRTFLTPSRGYSCGSRRGPRLLREPRLPRPPCSHLREPPESRKVRESGIGTHLAAAFLENLVETPIEGSIHFCGWWVMLDKGFRVTRSCQKGDGSAVVFLGVALIRGWGLERRGSLASVPLCSGRVNRQFRWGCLLID
jgi:hypothetical protein